MSEFDKRLRETLEPILASADPREKLSAYHDMPYALFRYDPADEFALRREVRLLGERLMQRAKRVTFVSLSDCLWTALKSQESLESWFRAERENGVADVIDTVTSTLDDIAPLVDLVAEQMPQDPDPRTDVALITRAGALFPVYRTFSLLEQVKGRVMVPTVLFYPGYLDGASGLRFMGVLDAEHNYRPKIF